MLNEIDPTPTDRITKMVKLRNVNATVVSIKTAAGKLVSLEVENNQAAAAWVQLFDKATAGVTVGTDEPDKQFLVPANGSLRLTWPFPHVPFKTAISVACTTAEKGAVGSAAGIVLYATVV